MATLKISDLSVGDWVRWKVDDKTYDMQVSGVTDRRIYGLHDGIEYSMLLTQICPIPITAEILEKNGFERLLERDLFYHSESGLEVAFEDGEWKHTINIHEYTIHTISGVHHIQHLLRLYGCEKEINL